MPNFRFRPACESLDPRLVPTAAPVATFENNAVFVDGVQVGSVAADGTLTLNGETVTGDVTALLNQEHAEDNLLYVDSPLTAADVLAANAGANPAPPAGGPGRPATPE